VHEYGSQTPTVALCYNCLKSSIGSDLDFIGSAAGELYNDEKRLRIE
jgi:hypothetical protein